MVCAARRNCEWCGKPLVMDRPKRFHAECSRKYHAKKDRQKRRQMLANSRSPRRCLQCDQLFPLGWPWAVKIHPECQADRRRASEKRNQILAKAMAALLREQRINADRFMEGLS